MDSKDKSDEYLELFTPIVIDDLFGIMRSSSNNHEKADMVVEYLKDMKFEEVGLGTNIICMKNKRYDDVVFKIALDPRGIEDNFNDVWLSQDIPEYAKVYGCHRTGMVSVQQYYKVFKTEQALSRYYKDIIKLLNRISKKYLIADLSATPKNMMNYGVDKNKKLVIVDGSDMISLDSGVHEFKCREIFVKKNKSAVCGGELEYDVDYSCLICKKCGKEIDPSSLRKVFSKEVNIMKAKHFTTGLSDSQEQMLEKYLKKKRSGDVVPESPPKQEELVVEKSYEAEEELTVEERSEEEESREIKCSIISKMTGDATIIDDDSNSEEDEDTITLRHREDVDDKEEEIEEISEPDYMVGYNMEMGTSTITDYDDQIVVELDPDNKEIIYEIDGDLGILTRSEINILIKTPRQGTICITPLELFNIANGKL